MSVSIRAHTHTSATHDSRADETDSYILNLQSSFIAGNINMPRYNILWIMCFGHILVISVCPRIYIVLLDGRIGKLYFD